MDNRITKTRLSNLLSYDWLKIIAIIVAIVLVWSLAFTIGAPRASVGQTFGLFTYADFGVAESEGELLSDAKENGAFSYDVLDFGTRSLTEDYFGTIMSAANSVREGDIMITSDFPEARDKHKSRMRTFVDGYYSVVYDFDSLISDAKDYALSHGVVESDGKFAIDEQVVESVFSARMEKDPRFRNKKSQKYLGGVKSESERIKAVWNNACMLEKVLGEHPEVAVKYRVFTQVLDSLDKEDRTYDEYYKLWEKETEKIYALDLGKLVGGRDNVKDVFARNVKLENDEQLVSSDGVVLCVFNYKFSQPDLQYETLGFVGYMIGRFSNFLEEKPTDYIA